MAKFEVTKSFEAIKCNRRTGLPIGGPPLMLAFGAILEDVIEDRDVFKFKYLGEPYRAPMDKMAGAFQPIGATDGASGSGPKSVPTDRTAESAAPRAVVQRLEAEIVWEPIGSAPPTFRSSVPGGWLVLVDGSGLTFLPDSGHKWKLGA